MIVLKHKAKWMGGAAVGMMLSSAPLLVQAGDVSFSGMIRQEMAWSIGDGNSFNQHANPFNDKPMTNRITGLTNTRADYTQDNDWNLMATRVEIDMNAQISDDWTAFVRLRGFFDNNIYEDFGDVNQFESGFWGDCGSAVEICDENYMVDLPSAYLDYANGPVWLRIGNQQIAWGESIFFRVLDVPNGLDLRRHSFLDWASEEYADERVSAPAIRGSVRFAERWELEGFVQLFSPTVLGIENSTYTMLPTPFVRHETEAFDDVRGDVTTGFRLKGQIGELGLQFMAVNRRNPDGYFGWTETGVNPFAGSSDPALAGLGALLAQQPFEPFTGQGLVSADEFYMYATDTYVSPAGLTYTAINEFPAAQALAAPFVTAGIIPVDPATGEHIINDSNAGLILDGFFSPVAGLGNLRGHIKRKYPLENVFGFGMNYMFFADPDSFLDQLIVRFEATYTPDKKFTNSNLSMKPIEADEFSAALVFEKYQRFSENFPATYMVFQWLHKSESDMFGRHLSGYDGSTTVGRGEPKGRADFDALAFALQQPSKTLMWRFDLAILYDVKGGHYIQPAVRYKPNGEWTVEGYGNFLDGNRDDVMGGLDWADEIGMRIGYQF